MVLGPGHFVTFVEVPWFLGYGIRIKMLCFEVTRKGVSSLHDWGNAKFHHDSSMSPPNQNARRMWPRQKQERVIWSAGHPGCDSGSQIRLSLWWLCEDTNCFHLTSAWSRRAGCVIYKGGLPWKSPLKINPFLIKTCLMDFVLVKSMQIVA